MAFKREMIIEKFSQWKDIKTDDEEFMRFVQSYVSGFDSLDELLYSMIYQIYIGQCCLEGIIEDMEFSNEEID